MSMKTSSKVFFGAVLVLVGLLFWFLPSPLGKITKNIPDVIKNLSTGTVATQIKNIKQEVFAPPPLKSNSPKIENSVLTIAGIISWTNINREQNGAEPALKENTKLNQSAKLKLEDMFKQQYFEHESPSGAGPADLAKTVGYEYLSIGENLALGFFKDNEELVTAWMNSPGHRENILNTKFTEIGVAVAKGFYKGEETWIAVQEFGRPTSNCPAVDASLKALILSLEQEVDRLHAELTAKRQELESMDPKTKQEYEDYNTKVADFNNLVKNYNNKVDLLKMTSNKYNTQVSAYNLCLDK